MTNEMPPSTRSANLFVSATNYSQAIFARRRPVQELLDIRSFALPSGYFDYISRLRKNVAYFSVNYLIFLLIILAGIITFRPTSLGMLAVLTMVWVYLLVVRDAELQVGKYILSVKSQTILLAILSFLSIFYLTNIGALLGTGLTIGVLLICVHAGLRTPHQDKVDVENQENTFFGGVTSLMARSINPETLQKLNIDSVRTTFKLPDNSFTRGLERGVDSLVSKVEGGMNL
mmetsp:Transcript_33833/g.46842  ORF Transcript_33833/g.46842 Transcript_33833/m.46842 type:complete len:231 (+) Transcript_33833:88-780(+)